MGGFATLLVSLAIIGFIGSWIVPWLLAWLLKYKFSVNVSIGRVGMGWPYLTFKDVYVTRNGFSIQIEEVALRSSFLSSEVSKLLLVIIRDVRIKKDIGSTDGDIVPPKTPRKTPFDFHNARVPPVIITVTQFMAVHVHRVTVMLLRPASPEWLIHAAAEELYVDGSVVHGARLLASVRCSAASAKVLKHSAPPTSPSDDVQVVLGEVTFGLSLEATLLAQGPLSVENLSIVIEKPQAVINEGFYEFAQERGLEKQQVPVRASPGPVWHQEETSSVLGIVCIIPKEFSLKVEGTTLTGMRDHSRPDFYAVLHSFMVESTFNPAVPSLPFDLMLNIQLEELKVKCTNLTMLRLKKFSLDGKILEGMPRLNVLLDTLAVTYNHKDIHKWVFTNFKTAAKPQVIRIARRPRKPPPAWLTELLSQSQACVELWSVSVALQLSDVHHAGLGFSHTKLSIEQSPTENQEVVASVLSGELLVEALWCRLGPPSQCSPDAQAKRQHVWGTPVYLGVLLLQLRATHNIKAMLDCVRFEWSLELAKCLEQSARCLMDYQPLFPQQVNKASSETPSTPKLSILSQYSTSVSLSNVNVFLVAYENVCIMTRLDTSKLESNGDKIVFICEGAKTTSMCSSESYYNCIRSEELKSAWAYMKMLRVSFKPAVNELNIQLNEEIHAKWSTILHLKLLHLTKEIQAFVGDFKSVLKRRQSEPKVLPQPTDAGPTRTTNIRVRGILSLAITISSRHHVKLTSEDLSIAITCDNVSVQSQMSRIAIDGADIFLIEGLQVAKIKDNEEIRIERANNENFVLPWNKTWAVNIASLCARFPYEHNFAEAVQNEFVSLYKWLKIVHQHQRKSFTADSPLPSDLLIKVQEFVFEMSDDPFEVKLRDNFELLEDEYQESLKRQKMLDAKVEELLKAHLLLPAGKVEELYSSLSKKNAEIYIQRSKQMSLAGPSRTRLFAWTMQEVEILALADPSIHGKERAVTVMREIDEDSPWPEKGLDFTTLWCRAIRTSCREWKFLLRDFPQPLLHIRSMLVWGRLVGAEQEATRRAKRTCIVELGEPWTNEIVERGMTSLKFYHDFSCDVEHFSYAFGPCWEPVIAQCNLSFERISSPSRDPSPPMPFWDKMRLLFHGRLTMSITQLTVLLHASLDPYNTTEEMELTWSDVVMDWTTAKFVFKGDLNVYVRTASKYDDCRLLHLPNLKLTIKLNWVCLSDPNDHHAVMPCAPDKLPEYSSNQEHDSFRAFRSQNVNASIALETKPVMDAAAAIEYDFPIALLYGSTLRWFESLKLILSGVTRPTRRGRQFKNVRPRKLQLSRHYKRVHLSLGLHRFQVCYWMSFAMQRGFELLGGRVSSSSEHILNLVPIDDGLKHRPRAEWSICYMNCELNDAEIWLQTALQEDPGKEHVSLRQPVEKCYFLSVAKVSYGRETSIGQEEKPRDAPHHRLVVYDLKGAWTKSNRDVAFALFDSFVKAKQLKKNLSTEALKGFQRETTNTPMKNRPRPNEAGQVTSPSSALQQATPSPMTKLQSGHAATMLQQLIAEAENKAVVFSDDLSTQTKEQLLQGLAACHEDDVLFENWHIVLVNSQVLLKGCETKGYVIMSAAKAQILQRIHRPAWKQHTLVSKSTWVGSLECMQYYATVSAGRNDPLDENIMWLTVDNIEEKDSTVIAELPDVPHIVGSGQSVGGVVSETVGASYETENSPIQLQRIVSRCKCEFFYAGYGENSMDPGSLDQVPPPPSDDRAGPWEQKEQVVDAFTLMHYDLDVCTNSLQYAMILDIVNNLLLHVEPRRKEASERLQRMRFQLQLHSVQDQRRPIQQLQNHVRSLVSKQRRLEKKAHQVQAKLADDPVNPELLQEMETLEEQLYECKELFTTESEELNMMLSCYKETQISASQKLATSKGDKSVATLRANEICFKHAQWRLTEADGQLGIADLVLSNFLYTKNSRSDDSVEHLLELGYVRMTNLLPNQIYTEVLLPTEIQSNMPVDQKRAVRVFCREKAPVGGISVKEHFEINVVPLTIGLTKQFYNTMLKFCFPERDPNSIDGEEDIESADGKSKKLKGKKGKETNFYVKIDRKDDVEKMKERADKNKLFIYIKIPEVPVKVSYKGSKEKNLEDIRDFSLTIPTLEYHNVTWTWLDLLLAMKSDSRRVILSQAIKQKLQIKMNPRPQLEERASPQEEDKARMLLGARLVPGDTSRNSLKKSIFKSSK